MVYWDRLLIASALLLFSQFGLLRCQEDIQNEKPKKALRPNIIVLMVDDLGYGDLASYGNPSQERTPVDELISEGTRFTQAYSPDSLCTPSRAGFMTGRLPVRLGIYGNEGRVLVPVMNGSLPLHEKIIPEMLKENNYTTGMIGKWNLGINHHNKTDGMFLPKQRGFDFVGLNLPFTNVWECDTSHEFQTNISVDPTEQCFLYNESTVVQQPIKFDHLTEQLVDEWRRFFVGKTKNGTIENPFFFYFAFPHVHTTLFANSKHKGKSVRGLFGDNINEMAWAVGEVMNDIKNSVIADNTLVIFMSDHGPHVEMCNHGGSTAGLKGGKSNTFEGGFRIPFAAWMPKYIKHGAVSNEVISSLDLYATIQILANGSRPTVNAHSNKTLPTSHCLDLNSLPVNASNPNDLEHKEDLCRDGVDVWCELRGYSSDDPECHDDSRVVIEKVGDRRPIFYYCNDLLLSIRLGYHKVVYRTSKIFYNFTKDPDLKDFCPEGVPPKDWYVDLDCNAHNLTNLTHPELYHLGNDPYELFPLANCSEHIKVIERIGYIRDIHQAKLWKPESQLRRHGKEVVPCCEQDGQPRCHCDLIPPFNSTGDTEESDMQRLAKKAHAAYKMQKQYLEDEQLGHHPTKGGNSKLMEFLEDGSDEEKEEI